MKICSAFALLCCTLFSIAQNQTYRIGMLIDQKTAEVEPILQQLQNQITTVVGEDATIIFDEQQILFNAFNLERANDNYKQLIENNTDLILAFGAVSAAVIAEQTTFPKPTILFGTVNKDLIPFQLNQPTSGIENFTYLLESKSYQEDLEKFKELTDFKSLGVLIEKQLMDILPVQTIFDRQLKDLEADYRLIPFLNTQDILSNLENLDAVYLAGGFLLSDAEITQLSNTFIEKQLPAFTATGIEDVESGLFATNRQADNSEQIQRRIALTVEAFVSGTPLSDMPVLIENTPRLTINFNTAELLNIPIKYSLIGSTDFVGDLKNVLSEKEYNLLTAINQVLSENLTLQSSQKDIDLVQQDLAIAKADYLPNVEAAVSGAYVDPDLAEASFGQNPEFSTSGAITASQLVFSQSVNTNIAVQKRQLKAQEQNFSATQLDLIFDIANVYLEALISKVNSQIQLDNLDLTKKNLEIAEQNFEVGESGKSDVLRFRSQLAQNTQSMVEAINALEQNFVSLNQLLNNPLDLEIDIEDVALDEGVFEQYNYEQLITFLDDSRLREPFIDFLVAEALKNAPELKALNYDLEASQLFVDLYGQGRYYPTVALQGEYNQAFNRSGAGSETTIPKGSYNLGVSVSLPLFNQNLNNLNQQSAILQKEQLTINQANTELSIAANVRNNILNLINQIANIELSKISESTAEETLELTQIAYSSGSVNIIQLIDAQNNYLNAQVTRASAVYNFMINALQMERSLGFFFLLNSVEDNANFRQQFLAYMKQNGG